MKDLERAEALNAAIAKALGGDKCHNVDRIMRIPGTINVPNEKKRKAGRVAALAYLVEENWERRYSLADFSALEAVPPTTPAPTKEASGTTTTPWVGDLAQVVEVEMDALPEAVPLDVRRIIEHGDDLERPRGTETARFPSRSEAVWHVACELAKAGCTAVMIAGILINPVLKISESVLEKKGRTRKYALKQAKAAWVAIESGWPDCDAKGRPRASMRNAATALRRLELRFGYDVFRFRKTVEGHAIQEFQGEISDDACMVLRGLIIEKFGFDALTQHVRDAVHLLCLENMHHPVREMLDALMWDEVPRLDRWLINYLGAADTPLNEAISATALIAAVRRVRQPGAKFDQIVVLEGPQGTGKSTSLKILAGAGNHSDQDILTLEGRDQMQLLEGVWIYELGELGGLSRGDLNKIKAFASRDVDHGRLPCAHHPVARPRQTIFIGTTNDDTYLRDPTGNRRFWPVRTGTIDLGALPRDRDQLLAEAAYREAQGESIALPEELWAAAAVEQEGRVEEDPWAEKIEKAIPQVAGETLRLYTKDLLDEALGLSTSEQHQGATKRLATVMKKLGWAKEKFHVDGRVVRGYARPKPEGYIPPRRPTSTY